MSGAIPMRELFERLCAGRGVSVEKAREKRLPPRINIVQLDNLQIIRDLGAKNTEVWEEFYNDDDDCGVAA